MKILELESSKGWGGQEKRTVRLNNNLPKEFEIYWGVERDSTLFEKRDEIRGEFFDIELNKIYNLKTIYKLSKFITNKNIDIIVTHSGKDAWIGNIVGKITKTPVVRVRHILMPVKSPRTFNLATKVVCVSKQVENYLKSIGVKEEKLELIYTGIDTEKFIPTIKKDYKKIWNVDNEVVIGIVAVLRGAKRHKDLLYAIKDLENVKLVIVGDGPQRENIEKLIRELKISSKVIMMGHQENVPEILPNFDIFVLPSNIEALGTALLEAQSAGVPVVASNVGGIPECVKEGETGFLFEKENVEDLKNKLKILINNKELREKFSKNARDWIVKNFSTHKMVNDTVELYKRVLK